MMKTKPVLLNLALVGITAGALLASVGIQLVWPGRQSVNQPLHSAMEGLGGLAALVLAFGRWTLAFPDQLPQMIRDGQFTATAIAPKSLACMLFLAGATRFLADFRRSGRSDDYLFACLALLFGVAEFMFTYSALWDSGGWYWHALRVMT